MSTISLGLEEDHPIREHPFSDHPYLSQVPYVDTSSLFSLPDVETVRELIAYYGNPVVVEIRSVYKSDPKDEHRLGEPSFYAIHHSNPARLDGSWGVALSCIDEEDTRRCTVECLIRGFIPVACVARNASITGEKVGFVGRMDDLSVPNMRDPRDIFKRQFAYLHEAERRIRARGAM